MPEIGHWRAHRYSADGHQRESQAAGQLESEALPGAAPAIGGLRECHPFQQILALTNRRKTVRRIASSAR